MKIDLGSLTPCSTCPFKIGVEFEYDPYTMMQNIDFGIEGGAHSCHSTDKRTGLCRKGYKGGVKSCAGMLSMQKKRNIWPKVLNTLPVKEAMKTWDVIPQDESTHSFDSFVKFALKSITEEAKAERLKEENI